MVENKQIAYTFIDEEDVLTRLSGNINLFNKLFAQFITGYRFSNADVQQLIQGKDYENARLLIHKIKGIAANLGIKNLYEAASNLESDIVSENQEKIEETFKLFSDTLEEIVVEVSES